MVAMVDTMSINVSLQDVAALYHTPLLDLLFEAATVHRKHNDPSEVQVSTLISIKTGACPEDCAYCPQAARYQTDVDVHKLMELDQVMAKAREAKAAGSSRLCIGAAWREVKDNKDFDRVLEMVTEVNSLGLEVCCTLGMLSETQAQKLADAGLYAYNHNLDTSSDYYDEIISTRNYQDRLDTLAHVRKTGVTVCSGGIIGMGETDDDRIGLIATLCNLEEPPESVPINALVAVEGTPLEDQKPVAIWDMLRMIATVRVLLPKTVVRLSAGRNDMSATDQALCFLAGANSIFAGDKLLTTPNPDYGDDKALFELLGLRPKEAEPTEVPVDLANACV